MLVCLFDLNFTSFNRKFVLTPIVGVCNCSMFCCALLCVHSCFAVVFLGKRELIALLSLSCWCLVIVVWVIGLSTDCDFGISCSYLLTILKVKVLCLSIDLASS